MERTPKKPEDIPQKLAGEPGRFSMSPSKDPSELLGRIVESFCQDGKHPCESRFIFHTIAQLHGRQASCSLATGVSLPSRKRRGRSKKKHPRNTIAQVNVKGEKKETARKDKENLQPPQIERKLKIRLDRSDEVQAHVALNRQKNEIEKHSSQHEGKTGQAGPLSIVQVDFWGDPCRIHQGSLLEAHNFSYLKGRRSKKGCPQLPFERDEIIAPFFFRIGDQDIFFKFLDTLAPEKRSCSISSGCFGGGLRVQTDLLRVVQPPTEVNARFGNMPLLCYSKTQDEKVMVEIT